MRLLRLKLTFFLAMIVILSACKESMSSEIVDNMNDNNDVALDYLALGDSYTIGESVSAEQRWPVQLADSLRTNGCQINNPHIIARTGWTTDELMDAVEQTQPDSNFSIVSLLIGVNNQYRGYPIDKYRKEFKILLNKAILFAGGDASRVFVLSIPDYGVTPFAGGLNSNQIAMEIDQYNSIGKEETEKTGALFFNITAISREAEYDAELIANDGLHPSGKMYAQWVKLILPEIINLLEN